VTRKTLGIIAFVLVVCTIAGCTTTNNTNQTPSATLSAISGAVASTATQHDALEKFIAAYKNASSSDSSRQITAWKLEWVNSSSAHLQWTSVDKTSNHTLDYDVTYMVFPTSQDATNYLIAMNKTAYNLSSTEYPSGGVYQNVTGHAPQIYKGYVYEEQTPSNISENKRYEIQQLDNIVFVSTVLG